MTLEYLPGVKINEIDISVASRPLTESIPLMIYGGASGGPYDTIYKFDDLSVFVKTFGADTKATKAAYYYAYFTGNPIYFKRVIPESLVNLSDTDKNNLANVASYFYIDNVSWFSYSEETPDYNYLPSNQNFNLNSYWNKHGIVTTLNWKTFIIFGPPDSGDINDWWKTDHFEIPIKIVKIDSSQYDLSSLENKLATFYTYARNYSVQAQAISQQALYQSLVAEITSYKENTGEIEIIDGYILRIEYTDDGGTPAYLTEITVKLQDSATNDKLVGTYDLTDSDCPYQNVEVSVKNIYDLVFGSFINDGFTPFHIFDAKAQFKENALNSSPSIIEYIENSSYKKEINSVSDDGTITYNNTTTTTLYDAIINDVANGNLTSKDYDFYLMLTPDQGVTREDSTILSAVIGVINERQDFLYIPWIPDETFNLTETDFEQHVKDFIVTIPGTSGDYSLSYVASLYPNPLDGEGNEFADLSLAIAIGRLGINNLYKAPAGIQRGTLYFNTFNKILSNTQADKLYKYRINTIIKPTTGQSASKVIWGNSTMYFAGTPTVQSSMTSLNVRMSLLVLKRRLYGIISQYVFETMPLDVLYGRFVDDASNVLKRYKGKFFDTIDFENITTDEEYQNKTAHFRMILIPLPAVERIILDVYVGPAGATISEILERI